MHCMLIQTVSTLEDFADRDLIALESAFQQNSSVRPPPTHLTPLRVLSSHPYGVTKSVTTKSYMLKFNNKETKKT